MCSALFHVIPGADVSGMDLSAASIFAASPEDCCVACSHQGVTCAGAVLVGDKCWLKRVGMSRRLKRNPLECGTPNPRTVVFVSVAESVEFPEAVVRCPEVDRVATNKKAGATLAAANSFARAKDRAAAFAANKAALVKKKSRQFGAAAVTYSGKDTGGTVAVSPDCPALLEAPREALKTRMTVIMATSPRPAGHCILHIRSALRSLFLRLPELLAVRLIIAYDGCPEGKPLYWEAVSWGSAQCVVPNIHKHTTVL